MKSRFNMGSWLAGHDSPLRRQLGGSLDREIRPGAAATWATAGLAGVTLAGAAPSSSFEFVGQREHEVHDVPNLVRFQSRVVARHLGPGDPLGDPPVDVERPPAPLNTPRFRLLGRSGLPQSSSEFFHCSRTSLAIVLQTLVLKARVTAEDHLVEDILRDEAHAIAERLRPVAADAVDAVSLRDLWPRNRSRPRRTLCRVDGVRGTGGLNTWASTDFHLLMTFLHDAVDDLVGECLGIVLIGDRGFVDQAELGLPRMLRKSGVVEDLLDLAGRPSSSRTPASRCRGGRLESSRRRSSRSRLGRWGWR